MFYQRNLFEVLLTKVSTGCFYQRNLNMEKGVSSRLLFLRQCDCYTERLAPPRSLFGALLVLTYFIINQSRGYKVLPNYGQRKSSVVKLSITLEVSSVCFQSHRIMSVFCFCAESSTSVCPLSSELSK